MSPLVIASLDFDSSRWRTGRRSLPCEWLWWGRITWGGFCFRSGLEVAPPLVYFCHCGREIRRHHYIVITSTVIAFI